MPTTTFLLIRHGAHLLGPDLLAGRTPGVFLSPLGIEQVQQTAQRLAAIRIDALYASPIDRCQQTAQLIAEKINLRVQTRVALAELDYGDWTRQPVADIAGEERFKRWNGHRSGTQIPGGEWMFDVQTRVVREMFELRDAHPDGTVALVSHGDVIKAAAAYALGTPLDLLLRIEISLASVTIINWGDYGPWLLTLNNTPHLPMLHPM